MKRVLAIAALTVFTFQSGALFGQTTDPIPSIRQRYAAINKSLAKYRKVRKDLAGFSAEGGQLVAYFKGQSIMKIAATYYGEGGRTVEEYFYWEDKLIFAFRKDLKYSRPLSGKVVSTEENRFYFNGDELIMWIDGSGKEVARGSEYVEKQTEYLKTSKLLTDGARSRKPTIEAID